MTTTIHKRRLVPLLLAACFGAAVAAPTGQQVVAGQATFNQQGNVFSITNTPGTIINWQSFSINQGEITRFIQQSSDSAVLNRIVGQDPSRILGALQSNGKVFLINPNGILFGRDSRVDVNGLVASTLNMSNADFLAGKKNFTAGASAGEVRNEGAITTPAGGQVFLIAPSVTNAGIITSPKGDVVLAAGHSVQLVDSRDPDMHVVVSAPENQAINLGQVVAQGGRIGIYGALVNQRGVVNANSAVVGGNGKIVLKASRDTVLEQGSVTSATGAGKGGDLHLLGERVSLTGNAQVDASGTQGGGAVLVGGDWQGKNAALPNARETVLDKDASIKADAIASGDGGKVVLWSDASTRAFGSISAQGGARGGNGGNIETSGHNLGVDGIRVSAGAASGKAGTWLLDPYNIEVVASGSGTVAQVGDRASGADSTTSTISSSLLKSASGTNILLNARNDITISDAISTTGGLTAQAGNDINVNANVTSTAGDLQFNAGRRFNLAAGATVKGNKNIDVIADQMIFAGTIGRATSGSNLVVGLTTQTAALPIRIGGSSDGLWLWLDPAKLANISAYELNIGTSGNTGGISVESAVNRTGHFVMDTSGPLAINAAVNLDANSSFIAALHGDQGTLLDVNAAITAKNVTLYGDGLRINAAVNASGSVTVAPHTPGAETNLGTLQEGDLSLTQDMLLKLNTPSLTIGGKVGQAAGIRVSSGIDLTSHPFGTLTLNAGDGDITMDGILTMPSGVVSLKSNSGIYQNADGGLKVDKLAVQAGLVDLGGYNQIGTIAGSASSDGFRLNATGPVRIGQVSTQSGISAAGGDVEVYTDGAVTLDKNIDAGTNWARLESDSVGGSGSVKASRLMIHSNTGVGSTTAALNTQTDRLSVYSEQAGGAIINISNTGDLTIDEAVQGGESLTANTGALTIRTSGNMTVPGAVAGPPTLATGPSVPGVVGTHSGAIRLTAGGSIAIDGSVGSDSGSISLTAGNGMTVRGQVVTSTGDINLLADNGSKFTTVSGAQVATETGAINITAGSSAIVDGTIHGPAGKVTLTIGKKPDPQPEPEPQKPTVDQCVTNPAAAGCGNVIDDAKRACSANWNAGHCEDVMPKVDFCKTNPTALGCEAVIKRDAVLQCAANPRGANCGDVLPKYEECKGQSGALGCDAVIQEHDKVSACMTNPTAACYKDVLPAFDTCSQKPDTFGCSTVVKRHDDISACVVNPKGANCSSVLPPLDACHANASEFGCQPVLAREKFEGCVANASGPGCDAVLPALDVCKGTPSAEGCGAVIKKTFDFCLTSPNDAKCVGVLPKISECVSDKSQPGCQVVLPTMNQCIGSPSLQGCSVILPKIEQCAANPNTTGCEAVLPKPDFCSTHPLDPTCRIVSPGSGGNSSDGKQVKQAVDTSVTLINTSTGKVAGAGSSGTAAGAGVGASAGTGSTSGSNNGSNSDKPSDKQSGPAASENSGAKNEKPATKMYCN